MAALQAESPRHKCHYGTNHPYRAQRPPNGLCASTFNRAQRPPNGLCASTFNRAQRPPNGLCASTFNRAQRPPNGLCASTFNRAQRPPNGLCASTFNRAQRPPNGLCASTFNRAQLDSGISWSRSIVGIVLHEIGNRQAEFGKAVGDLVSGVVYAQVMPRFV